MDRWTTLEPVKLYGGGSSSASASSSKPSKPKAPPNPNLYARYIGPLPVDIHILVIQFLPIASLPSYALASRSLARLLHDERIWKRKCAVLRLNDPAVSALLAGIEDPNGVSSATPQLGGSTKNRPPPPVLAVEEDEFGDFASAPLASTLTSNGFGDPQSSPIPTFSASDTPSSSISRTTYIHAHLILRSLASRLPGTAPHLLLTALFPPPNTPPIRQQGLTLALLSRFLSPPLQPLLLWHHLRSILASAIDRFQAGVLAAFEAADSAGDEEGMRDAAWSSWEVWEVSEGSSSSSGITALGVSYGGGAEWELGRVWAEKLEIFYEGGNWDPSQNFTNEDALTFEAMDDFMNHVVESLTKYGAQAVRVFPLQSKVLLAFAERLANEVVGEYITPLLTRARSLSNTELFLQACAASFVQSWRLVTALLDVGHVESPTLPGGAKFGVTAPPVVAKDRRKSMSVGVNGTEGKEEAAMSWTQAEDVIYLMFEQNMDEYLEEEIDHLRLTLEAVCSQWDRKTASSDAPLEVGAETRFLASSNPAAVKRTVLASFTDLMLLPVTIVPRGVSAVGAIVQTGGSAAVQGIAMLNPGRWIGTNGATSSGGADVDGYRDTRAVVEKETVVFKTVGEDGEEEDDLTVIENPNDTSSTVSTKHTSIMNNNRASIASTAPSSRHSVASKSQPATTPSFETLQLLLSLDTALSLIHADREALKRVETFAGYPGHYGHRVKDTIEEVFILLVQIMGAKHIVPGFARATEQMKAYNPTEASDSEHVAPLMQFFELVHVGDMIQSMVQVYFDKEVARHIDRTDFLNGVVREKKQFENSLDDSVAHGLNTGTEILMNQVEHIIQSKTGPREYYPVEGSTMDLQPTVGCREAIACLKLHCDILKGSTTKEVLEVFHQEIGIRLHAIIQKHLKRQIISLEGGFQVIADLNAYHAFISTLRVPLIAADFANLKMLGHVYIVEDAKDLAQIVRDVTRYGGSFRPEDIYEFIQRRSDWKKIEKTVDKAMYNLSFREDCIIC